MVAAVGNVGMFTAEGLEICSLGADGSSPATGAKGTLASRVALGGRAVGCMEAGAVAELVGHGGEDIPLKASRVCGPSLSMDAQKRSH